MENLCCEACSEPLDQTHYNGRKLRFCKVKTCEDARQKARWQKWRDKLDYQEFRDYTNDLQRSYRARSDYHRDYELQKKYGITIQQWLAMLERASYRCECCGAEGSDLVRLCCDHDHLTGEVRGVLCTKCNTGIGSLGDSVAGVQLALDYLLRVR